MNGRSLWNREMILCLLAGALFGGVSASAQVSTNLVNDGSTTNGLARVMNANGTAGQEILLTELGGETALRAEQTAGFSDFPIQAAWYGSNVRVLDTDYLAFAEARPFEEFAENLVGVMGWLDPVRGSGVAFRINPAGSAGAFQVSVIDFEANTAGSNDSVTGLYNLDGLPATAFYGSAWSELGNYAASQYASLRLEFRLPTNADKSALPDATARIVAEVFQPEEADGEPVQLGTTIELLTNLPRPTDSRLGYYASWGSDFIPGNVSGDVKNLGVVGNVEILNQPPEVAITNPSDGASFVAPATIDVTVEAVDHDGEVVRVEVWLDGELAGSSTDNPATIRLTDVGAGDHEITAQATDDDDETGHSAPVSVQVVEPPNEPELTNPQALPSLTDFTAFGFTVNGTAGATYTVESSADFVIWRILESGTMPSDAFAVSYPRQVGETMQFYRLRVGGEIEPPDQPPSVRLTNPANGAVFTAPATIELAAEATDEDGTVVRIEFYEGTTLVGEGVGDTASVTLENVVPGAYTYTAKAIDDKGLAGQSDPVGVTVEAGGSPEVELSDPAALPSTQEFDEFKFNLQAPVGSGYRVESSADLTSWVEVETGTVTESPQTLVYPRTTDGNLLFYRVVLP